MGSSYNVSHWCFVVFTLLVTIVVCVDSAGNETIDDDVRKELILTKREKYALDQLKSILPKKMPLKYLTMDLFLIRWLRGKNLDVAKAEREMHEMLDFRAKNKLPNFLQEDWSDLFDKQPFNIEGLDRQGRPVGYVNVGDGWDVRRIMLQGKRDRMNSYLFNILFELLEGKVAEAHSRHANVTQFIFIFNLEEFSTVKHACPLCISTYLYLWSLYERYLPGFSHDIIFVNAQSMFLALLEILRPVFSEHSNKVMKILGTNKNKWKPFLDSKIHPSQLPWELGGTRA